MRQQDPLASSSYRWRRIRGLLFNIVAASTIGLAVLVGVGRLLAPHADALRPQLVAWLSQQTNQEISIEAIEVQWPGLIPSIWIKGLTIVGEQDQSMGLDSAVVEFRLSGLLGRQALTTHIVLVGPRLVLTEQSEGQWGFGLMGVSERMDQAATDDLTRGSLTDRLPDWLGLSIRQAELVLEPLDEPPLDLHITEADVSIQDQQYRLTGWLSASPGAPEQVQFRLWMVQDQGRWVRAQAWLEAEQIALDYWLNEAGLVGFLDSKTVLTLETWVHWDQAQGARLDAQWTVAGTHGVVEGQASVLRWPEAQNKRGWAVEVYDLWFDDEQILDSLVWSKTDREQAWAVRFADLSAVHQAFSPLLHAWSQWPESSSGQVSDLALVLNDAWQVQEARGDLKQGALHHGSTGLTFSGLDLTLGQAGDRLALQLAGELNWHWPSVVDAEVALSSIDGQVLLDPNTLTFDDVALEASFLSARLNGQVYRTKDKPFLDLWIEAPRIESVDPRPFLPQTIIPPPAKRWLNAALVYVGEASGDVLMHFPVGLKTADFKPGHFASQVQFSDLEMNYANGWPVADGMQGQVHFLGSGLEGSVEHAKVNGLILSAPSIAIERFVDPVLELRLSGQDVPADALSNTLGSLPFAGWAETFAVMEWTQSVDATVSVSLPFKTMSRWSMEGQIGLRNNQLRFPSVGLELSELQGELSLNRSLLSSSRLEARLGEQDVELALQARLGGEPGVEVNTRLDVAALLADQAWPLAGLGSVEGTTDVTVQVARSSQTDHLGIQITSSLQGLALALPPPLAKPADEAWSTRVLWMPVETGSQWEVVVDGLGAATLRPGPDLWAIGVDAGGSTPPIPPINGGLEWVGPLDRLDVGQWQALMSRITATSETAGVPMRTWIQQYLGGQVFASASVADLVIPGVRPGAATVDVRLQADEWTVDIAGESIEGQLLIPTPSSQTRNWVVDLSHLHLLVSEPSSEEVIIRPPNLTDPRQSRPLTVLIESLYWGDLALGTTRVQSHLTADGVEIELLDIDGPDLRLQARGRWVQLGEGVPTTSMTGRLSSRNFNQLIQATGYQAGLQARQASLDFDLNWPGTPLDFNLIRLNGGLDFEVRGGNIPQASAGAGRLLGLMSFSALPRRLMLDFRDVFSSGFPFDNLKGRFELADGLAQTQGIKINSAVVVITLSGTTDMIGKTYDQRVQVQPGLGSTLPVIGGLAGGPVGAAAGLIIQSIFNQPLKGVSEVQYTITGPWSEPLIELVDAKVAPVANESVDPEGQENVDKPTEPPPIPRMNEGWGAPCLSRF